MTLSRKALALAALALLPATAILAQPAPPPPGAPAPAAALQLTPESAVAHLEGLGFTDVRFDEEDDGRFEFHVRDADGREVDIDIHPDGTIHQFDVDDDARATSVNLVDILPEHVRNVVQERGIVDVTEFDTSRAHYTVEGFNADGREIEIEIGFDALPGAIAVQTDRGPAPQAVDLQALTAQVEASGYVVDAAEARARHVEMTATNPEGEQVRLHVDFDGVIYRETLVQ